MLLCGPFRDNDGAFQLISAESYETAKAILESDPFIMNGYYQRYVLYDLIEANPGNNWLMDDSQTKTNIEAT